MYYLRTTLIIFSVISIFSCTSNEVGNNSDVKPESVYFDYKISGEEGNNDVTIMLQFRFAGQNGTTLLLDSTSKVELDGEILKADSSKFTGVFYEIQKPVQSFTGDHTITYTAIDGKKYEENFHFNPISLASSLPETINRADISFQLEGLKPKDYVRVLMTDTAFSSNGISRVDTVENGNLLIKKDDLKELANGPIAFELLKEDIADIKNGTAEGGKISISYRLKKDFFLAD